MGNSTTPPAFSPSDTQYDAIKAIRAWFENDTRSKQVFRLFGLAGTGKLVYFMAIEEAKFRAPVEPGVLLTLEAGFVQKRSRVCKFWGKASVDGKVTCEVQFTAMIADPRGKMRLDWGVTAPPETFIIRADGTVAYRYIGPMVGDDFTQRFLPELEKAKN